MSDDLLTEDELREAKVEADRILSQPAKEYRYTSDYRGGPRNAPIETLQATAIELTTASLVLQELSERRDEAEFIWLEQIEAAKLANVPMDHIAQYSGLKHRSSVYRALERLEEKRKQRHLAALAQEAIRNHIDTTR